MRTLILHNYRFKPNVIRFREFLAKHPSGGLRHVALHYETPSPAIEQSYWMKQERKHRVLLTDYAIHFLDLAWLFCGGPMQVHRYDLAWNGRDELESFSAALSFSGVACDILVRQGCHQRQCSIIYHFQNYSVHLRFFPDVFLPIISGHGLFDDARLTVAGVAAGAHKALERLRISTTDRSHDLVLSAFTGMTTTPGSASLS